jgi:hypothetical protein
MPVRTNEYNTYTFVRKAKGRSETVNRRKDNTMVKKRQKDKQ